MAKVLSIKIDAIEFEVRHDFLHRGRRERLVIGAKENGKYVEIHFNNTREVCGDIMRNDFKGKQYKAYWCAKEITETTVEILTTTQTQPQ